MATSEGEFVWSEPMTSATAAAPPGGPWVAHGLDPQGAMFAVLAPG